MLQKIFAAPVGGTLVVTHPRPEQGGADRWG